MEQSMGKDLFWLWVKGLFVPPFANLLTVYRDPKGQYPGGRPAYRQQWQRPLKSACGPRLALKRPGKPCGQVDSFQLLRGRKPQSDLSTKCYLAIDNVLFPYGVLYASIPQGSSMGIRTRSSYPLACGYDGPVHHTVTDHETIPTSTVHDIFASE